MNTSENKLPSFHTITYESDNQILPDIYVQEDLDDSDSALQIDENFHEDEPSNKKGEKSDLERKTLKRKQFNVKTDIYEQTTNDTNTSNLSLKFLKSTYKYQLQCLKNMLNQPLKNQCLTPTELKILFDKYKLDGHFRQNPNLPMFVTGNDLVHTDFDCNSRLCSTSFDNGANTNMKTNSYVTGTMNQNNNNSFNTLYIHSFSNNLHERGDLQTDLIYNEQEKSDDLLHSINNFNADWSYNQNTQNLHNVPVESCNQKNVNNYDLEYPVKNVLLLDDEQKQNINTYFDMNMYMNTSPVNISTCDTNFIDLSKPADSHSDLAQTYYMSNFSSQFDADLLPCTKQFKEAPPTIPNNILLNKNSVDDLYHTKYKIDL